MTLTFSAMQSQKAVAAYLRVYSYCLQLPYIIIDLYEAT